MMRAATILLAILGAARSGWAQSLLEQTSRPGDASSGPYDSPKRLPFKKHDHLQIVVSERSRALSTTELQTDRRSRLEVDLQNWVKFNGNKGLPTLDAAGLTNNPGMDLDARFRHDNKGRNGRQFDLTFTIMAEIIDIRPNGTLVVQATKRRKVNSDDEVIKLTGEVAPQSIVGDKVASDRLVNLTIVYEGEGTVSDVTKPGVLGWIVGKLWPF